MKSQDSHALRNVVLGSVISSIIFAGLAYLWPPFLTVIGWCWGHFVNFVGLFTSSYFVPGWALLVLAAIAIPSLWRVVVAFRRQEELPHATYVEDQINGATWRWNWSNNEISNLWCFCPRCDSELVYSVIGFDEETSFLCEHCNNSVVASITGGNKSYAISAVQREIRRRVRTNQFATRQEVSQLVVGGSIARGISSKTIG